MRFKLDENLPIQVASILASHGHDASTVYSEGITGSADTTLAALCVDEARVLVTLDLDLADIRQYPPHLYPGLIALRLKEQSADHVEAVCRRLVSLLDREDVLNRLWIVDEQRVRIR